MITAVSPALGESCTVPRWVVEFCQAAEVGDEDTGTRLWDAHVKGPAEVALLIQYKRIVSSVSQDDADEVMDAVLKRYDAA